MLDDIFYLYCRFKGMDATGYYTNNKNYLIQVKVGRFNKRIKIAHVHGVDNAHYPKSELRYENKESFEKTWKVIKDVTKEV